MDSIEEDTEEIEISFEEYLAKINQDRKERDMPAEGSASLEELDSLLNETELDELNSGA